MLADWHQRRWAGLSRSLGGTSPPACKIQSKHIHGTFGTARRTAAKSRAVSWLSEKRDKRHARDDLDRGSCHLRHFRESGLVTERPVRLPWSTSWMGRNGSWEWMNEWLSTTFQRTNGNAAVACSLAAEVWRGRDSHTCYVDRWT